MEEVARQKKVQSELCDRFMMIVNTQQKGRRRISSLSKLTIAPLSGYDGSVGTSQNSYSVNFPIAPVANVFITIFVIHHS